MGLKFFKVRGLDAMAKFRKIMYIFWIFMRRVHFEKLGCAVDRILQDPKLTTVFEEVLTKIGIDSQNSFSRLYVT